MQVPADILIQGICQTLSEKYEGMTFEYWQEDGELHRIRVEAAGIPIKTLRVRVERNSLIFENGLELF